MSNFVQVLIEQLLTHQFNSAWPLEDLDGTTGHYIIGKGEVGHVRAAIGTIHSEEAQPCQKSASNTSSLTCACCMLSNYTLICTCMLLNALNIITMESNNSNIHGITASAFLGCLGELLSLH